MAGEKYAGRLHVEGIPEGEPLFLLRAQDKLAAGAIAQYRDLLITAGLEDAARDVTTVITRFVEWQVLHGSKLPD